VSIYSDDRFVEGNVKGRMQIEIMRVSVEDKKKYYVCTLEISKEMEKKKLLGWIIREMCRWIDEEGNNLDEAGDLSCEKCSMKEILDIDLHYPGVSVGVIADLVGFGARLTTVDIEHERGE